MHFAQLICDGKAGKFFRCWVVFPGPGEFPIPGIESVVSSYQPKVARNGQIGETYAWTEAH